jgi:hypothetical protein
MILFATLAGCTIAPPPPPPPQPPALVVPAPPNPTTACLAALDARGILYQRVPDFHTPEGCGIDGAVRVTRSAVPWNRSALMTCGFAATLWDFETKVVLPAAKRFLGHNVTKLVHAGTYDCRGERGGDPNRLSQHAFGKAIDVLGFELDDGTTISVLKDWRDPGTKGQFIRAVAKGACRIFDMVITPNHNAFHVDHIHLDTGPYKMCGM